MSNVELSPNKSESKKFNWFLLVLLVLPLIVTAKIQFFCYPMITNGELGKACYSEPTLSQVIQDPHTHGNTLYKLASDPKSDESLLRDLSSKLDFPRVDYDPIILQTKLLDNKNTPSDVLLTIADNLISQNSLEENQQENLAKGQNTPEILLLKLIELNNEYVISQISQRPKLSRQTIEILWNKRNSNSTSNIYVLSGIASQENTPKEILEKLADRGDCTIDKKLDLNPTVEEKLGSKKAQDITNKVKKCGVTVGCDPQHGQNVGWGFLGGLGIMGLVLTIGSGGLLAPLAIGAGALAGVATTAAANFLSKCP